MENYSARIEALEKLLEDLILQLGRTNNRIYMLTQRVSFLEQEQHKAVHYNSKVVSL
ncbi:hypothetical protein [Bacillus sp. FJAT-49736]|uniref:hypothetical protein n=1 Tax=Bacillus sp. FJAT-49736 TaxID=2833582 RepID=UPI001BC92CB6|nr:hypothetical protein [Bacillus sp. FJAT-49736]MBS4175448.1 hypothetical protein [Bacillus sp. FJAT-49736]